MLILKNTLSFDCELALDLSYFDNWYFCFRRRNPP